jgi:hypothetical protein
VGEPEEKQQVAPLRCAPVPRQAGQQFFQLVCRYIVMVFYTTRIGLESLGFPGLSFYATSPGCTHHGNPEHIGL